MRLVDIGVLAWMEGGWNWMELELTGEHADACDRGCGRVDGEQMVENGWME